MRPSVPSGNGADRARTSAHAPRACTTTSDAAVFLFASESGVISAWHPNVGPQIPVGTGTVAGVAQSAFEATDGAVYTVKAAINTSSLFAISALKVNFYVQTFGTGLANPGQASFASLNLPPSGIAPMSSLVDTLGGTSLGSAWTLTQQTHGTVAESGGSLNFTPNANVGTAQLIVNSARPYLCGAPVDEHLSYPEIT